MLFSLAMFKTLNSSFPSLPVERWSLLVPPWCTLTLSGAVFTSPFLDFCQVGAVSFPLTSMSREGASVSRQEDLRAAILLRNYLESFWGLLVGADGDYRGGRTHSRPCFGAATTHTHFFCFLVKTAYSGRQLPNQLSQAHPTETLSFFSELPISISRVLRDPINFYLDIGDANRNKALVPKLVMV